MKKKYVYYEKTGQITDILSEKKKGKELYIECSIEEVVGFITGTKGITQWIVAYNNELKKYMLFEKNNIIMLRSPNQILYKIPYKEEAESNLKLTYYSDNVLEVSLDIADIIPLYQTNFRNEVKFEHGTEIRIIVKEKDKIIKTLIIEAQDLLESGQMFFELPPIDKNYIEFFTIKLFEKYSWSKGELKLISPIKEKIKFDIHKADHIQKSNNFSYHLIVTPTDTGISIQNNIENLNLIRFQKEIEFFVVDRHDPNILHDKFYLDKEKLERKNILIKLKKDIKGKTLIYNNKYISVLLKGDNYE